jgi:integrase
MMNKRSILRLICDEPVAPGSSRRIGDLPFADMTAKAVRMLRDRRADRPGTARNWVSELSTLFAWAIEAEHASTNPARDVPSTKLTSEGHHTWTLEEIRQNEERHPVGTPARLALVAYTGQRRSDIVRLGRRHMTGEGHLRFTQAKNEDRNPVTVEIPILPELQRVIEATKTIGHATFMVSERGDKMSATNFTRKFRKWCDEAALPHCSAHGMRKAAACAAAEGGATEMQMMAIFGWRDPGMARIYTRRASRTKMATESMHLLANRQNAERTNVSHFDASKKSGENK